MRVCHLSLGLSTGGLERLLVEFARHHDESTIELHFATLSGLGRPADDIRETGAAVHALPDRQGRKVRQLVVLTRFLRRLRPDILHTHNAYAHLYGSVAGQLSGRPVLVHTRHGRTLTGGRVEQVLFRVACTMSDAVVAVSEEVRALSLKQGCPAQKALTIWNGIDTTRFRQTGGNAGARIITVGRLEPVKDLATLLRAVSLAREWRGDLELTIVGDGSQRRVLEQLASGMGLDGPVRFLGERDDVPALLAEATIFVNSSLSEGISLSLLEATACGLGVIASHVGGNTEVIEDGTTGVLVPPGQPQALAKAIVSLLEAGVLPLMGEAARKRAQERFDVTRMVADYEAVYAKLLTSKPNPPRGN